MKQLRVFRYDRQLFERFWENSEEYNLVRMGLDGMMIRHLWSKEKQQLYVFAPDAVVSSSLGVEQ